MLCEKSFTNRYKNFKNKYIVQERRKHEYFINRYYAHLIDPFFTKLFYDLGLNPNTVTIISGLFGLGSAIAFFFEHLILGAILLQLHHFIDGADGNLARMLNKCTSLGAKLDKISDQLVRFVLFTTLAVVVDVPLGIKVSLIATIYLDLLIVQYYVLPYMKSHTLLRAKWKEWFLNKGIIPAFDIFTVFFLISLFALFNALDVVIYIIIIGKNIDWIYRVWEVYKTKRFIVNFNKLQ